MKNKRLIFIGLATSTIAGLFLWRKRNMSVIPNSSAGNTPEKNNTTNALSNREKKELQDRIKAMSNEELEIVVEALPVDFCMHRIRRELDKAAEIQASIERAYAMTKQCFSKLV